jgi:hypothetical protein
MPTVVPAIIEERVEKLGNCIYITSKCNSYRCPVCCVSPFEERYLAFLLR